MELPDPGQCAERSRLAGERAEAAAARLAHAEERLAKAKEDLASAGSEREVAAHRREIETHERAIAFHRRAVEDQVEAAALMHLHQRIDEQARDAGSMLAVLDATRDLLGAEMDHQERLRAHSEREQELIAEAREAATKARAEEEERNERAPSRA